MTVAGQTLDKASRIVGIHSEHLFRVRALSREKKLMADWLATETHALLSNGIRRKIALDVGLTKKQQARIKPAADPKLRAGG